MMIFENDFLVEQAKKDGLKTWEDLRDYLVDNCGYHELAVYSMDDFNDIIHDIMSGETFRASYAAKMLDKSFSFSDDFFYFDDRGYIHSEKKEHYCWELIDAYAEIKGK